MKRKREDDNDADDTVERTEESEALKKKKLFIYVSQCILLTKTNFAKTFV